MVERVIAGDREAFRTLIDKYRQYLFQVIYSVLNHSKDAEDVTQEAWVQIYYSLSQYGYQGFKTWITRIAVNKAIDYRRKTQRAKVHLAEELDNEVSLVQDPIEGVEEAVLRNENKLLLHRALSRVPPNYRDVLHAFYIEEKTYQEIAMEQGIELKSVESKLYRARNWARKHWREGDFG